MVCIGSVGDVRREKGGELNVFVCFESAKKPVEDLQLRSEALTKSGSGDAKNRAK